MSWRPWSFESALANLAHENALLKRRIYGNKNERSKTNELQLTLTLSDLLATEQQLQQELGAAVAKAEEAAEPAPRGSPDSRPRDAQGPARPLRQQAAAHLDRDPSRRTRGAKRWPHWLRRLLAAHVPSRRLVRPRRVRRPVVDCDAVLFDYAEHHTSDYVQQRFAGFYCYLQADTSPSSRAARPAADEDGVRLVGCWAHCRRYFFEAAICR